MALDKHTKKILLMVLVILLVILAGMAVYAFVASNAEESTTDYRIHQEVPVAEDYTMPTSKTEGYRSRTNDLYESLDEWEDLDRENKEEINGGSGRPAPKRYEVDDIINPSASEAEVPAKPKRPSSGQKTVVAKIPDIPEEVPSQDEVHEDESPVDIPAQKKASVKRSDAISSLDEDVFSDIGNGFSTLGGTENYIQEDGSKAYQCMFTRNEKISSGQRITIRILEDLLIGNIHIPRNTHLQGVCTITSRVQITVSSLNMGGKIVNLNFEAYDTDGQKGIYCSEINSDAQNAARDVLGLASRGLDSQLGRTARDIVNIGASMVRNKQGDVSVTIPAGYKFYIMEKTR